MASTFGSLWDDNEAPLSPSPFRPHPLYRQPLPQAEAQSMGKSLLQGGLSGLSYVGSVLDKPGRAVRGALAGRPDEIAAALPFSDSLGITDPERRVSGRDLLDKVGLTRKSSNGWGAWGAGLAADFATDPLTYATFGAKNALTPAGLVAKNAGKLKGLSRAETIAQGHGGLLGLGLPFRKPAAVLGTGPLAQQIAGGVDKAADFAKYKIPGAKTLSAAFDPAVNGATSEIAQRGWRKLGTPALDEGRAAARLQGASLLQKLEPVISGSGFPERDITAAARAAAEGVPTHRFAPALVDQVGDIGKEVASTGVQQIADARKVGAPLERHSDQFAPGYVHRQPLAMDPRSMQMRARGDQFPVVSGSNFHRDDPLRNVPGGTEALNRWSMDPRFSGAARTLPPAQVTRRIFQDMAADVRRGTVSSAGDPLTKELGQQLYAKAQALTDRFGSLSERHAAESMPLFTPDLAATQARRAEQHARTVASAKTVLGILGDRAQPFAPGMVPLSNAARQLNLRTWAAKKATGAPMEGGLVQLHNRLLGGSFSGGRKALAKTLDSRFGIDPAELADLVRQHAKWITPEEMKAPSGLLDSTTNFFKNLTYPIWPAAHIRNASSAAVTNTLRDQTPLGAYAKAFQVMTGRGGHDLSHLPGWADGGIEGVRRQLYGHGNVFSAHNAAYDQAGHAASALATPGGRFTPLPPGAGRAGTTGNLLGDTAGLIKEGLVGGEGHSPLDVMGQRGVGGRVSDTWSPLVAGRKVGTNVEDFFRTANWIGNVEKGMSPAMAGQRLNQLHFDYAKLTPFERNVMQRVFPFYTFMRKNLPQQAQSALTHPIELTSQTKPLQDQGQNHYIPKYMASGVALPVGDEQNGVQRYVSGLGLPIEEAFDRLKFANGMPDLAGTAMSYMGGMNPLLKAPLEQIFDKQFHTGRQLSDLRPTKVGKLGGLLSDDSAQLPSQILANSPVTRFVSTLDKLIDERKGVLPKAANLLTGLKVSDVDVDKMRAIDTRNALEEQLKHSPNIRRFNEFYVRPGQQLNMTPIEVQRVRMLEQLQEQARLHAQQQRFTQPPAS